jgi:hypothetical protein
MTSSQECRGYALECVQLAPKSEDESERAACFEMARAWLRAASVIDDTFPRYRGSLAAKPVPGSIRPVTSPTSLNWNACGHVERAHFACDTLHGARAKAELARHFHQPVIGPGYAFRRPG